MYLLCAVSRNLYYSLYLFHLSFSNYWISAHFSTKSSGIRACLRYGRNVVVLPTKPQQPAAEQSQTKIATFTSSMTNLIRDQKWQNAKNSQELIPDTLQSSLSLNTELLDVTIWMPVWDTPTLQCFPFCICVSIPVSVLWEFCAVQTETKTWGRKISLASFQLL